jgi:hypothetical protein
MRICKTIVLPVVLYAHETSSLELRGEDRLKVFESRVLKSIFVLKMDDVMGGE